MRISQPISVIREYCFLILHVFGPLSRGRRAVIAITGNSGIEGMLIHPGNRKGHNSIRTMERVDEFQVTLSPHLSYSLNISFRDFSSFIRGKDAMRSQ
jgi:hypothetical protein